MLSRSEAERRVAAFTVPDWHAARQRAVARLPGTSEEIAGLVIDGRRRRSDSGILSGLGEMKPRKRKRIFEALVPGHAEATERAWAHLVAGPFQHGYSRRPFRAPGTPALGLERRVRWLSRISDTVWRYGERPLDWYAAWAPYLDRASVPLGTLMAAEIESGPEGDAVFSILIESARGEHPVGAMGRHVVTALLGSPRSEGWELMEGMLRAAQRQEGLRQVILETVDEAHPEAFRRMIRLVVDEELTRFASVVRAFDVWFGAEFNVAHRTTVDRLLGTVVECLEQPPTIDRHLGGGEPEAAYAALWSQAWMDVGRVYRPAAELMTSSDPRLRYVATRIVSQVDLAPGQPLLLDRLDDVDPHVAWCAFTGLTRAGNTITTPNAFERLERYLSRVPGKARLEPLVWDWTETTVDPGPVLAAMVAHLGDRDPLRLAPYVGRMNVNVRASYARALAMAPTTPGVRKALIEMTGDRSQWVRRTVFDALSQITVAPEEASQLEALLTRKTASVRRSVIGLLGGQPDAEALASADRLLSAGSKLQREGGLDLVRELVAADRSADAARRLAERYAADAALSAHESELVSAITADDMEVPTLDDCLGLINVSHRSSPPEVRDRSPHISDEALSPLIAAADTLVEANRDLALRRQDVTGDDSQLYGDMRWMRMADLVTDEGRPLTHLWLDWWNDRAHQLDADALTLTRAVASLHLDRGNVRRANVTSLEPWESKLIDALLPVAPGTEYGIQVAAGIRWLWLNELDPDAVALTLDAAESTLAAVPRRVRTRGLVDRRWEGGHTQPNWDWRSSPAFAWLSLARTAFAGRPDVWHGEAVGRLWGLSRWLDEPAPGIDRRRPELAEFMAAHRAGHATDADLVDHLVGPRTRRGYSGYGLFRDLGEVTRRRPLPVLTDTPGASALVRVIVDRVLEVELARGEMPTAASVPALALRSVEGADRLVQLVQALNRRSLTRGWTWDIEATHSVLSHLIRVCVPSEHDTPARFAGMVAEARISESRLLDVAMYAPQWARYVEHTLGWDGLEEAVHWLHAHTKDNSWRVDRDIRELWAAEVARRTPLTAHELTGGAVDVAWYRQARQALGDERWALLDKAAKYASGGGGHKRAQLFADALAGELDEAALLVRISEKRHQDSVRALGLLPLPDDAGRTEVVLRRYEAVQHYAHGARKFGSQRRASETRAAETGLANLARTAGFRDPQRLSWAMETAAVADLAHGPLTSVRAEYEVSLSVGDQGEIALVAHKNGKPLKSIPAKLRKDPEIAELRRRETDLTRQASRMRTALEAAAVRGDTFDPQEVRRLFDHPILRPLLERLVWLDAGRPGYLAEDGTAVRDVHGDVARATGAPLRIAHPHDLFSSGDWPAWQHECFAAERIQPFKQIFRELYVMTDAERTDGTVSRRYQGHQVNPRQTSALLGSRGWVTHPEDGPTRTDHHAGISVYLGVAGGWFTPAEVDGMTLDVVTFTRKGSWQLLPLVDVPPRLFSETMRDIDLVVSVAHVGGVDPEASASSVEMRRSLVAETARLLGMDNVSFPGNHVTIDGQLGSYSVHLGSGVVHQRPGGAVCIVPVSAQHRGRLFLPFADDDPKTAEIVAKVVMLARDRDIKDPTILEQLVG